MASHFSSDTESLRAEIAAAAARLIAEDGLDYSSAKRKAAKQVLGNNKVRGDILPDNALIEEEVRVYNALFFGESQPGRLLHLRKLAFTLMQELAEYKPYLTGAVLNGTAGEHSDIHLHLFVESPKDVEIFLLNKGVSFELTETAHPISRKDPIEILSFMWRDEGVHLTLLPVEDTRHLKSGRDGRPIERADAQALALLINESKEQ
ncbi:hypothetical protein [Noviherbaspirillum sedimenti]|uniref:UDP-N-acetylmuramate--alanine ligase n=1 Tax=Noviherbaspirillum sedimenti TaxID=2320865 RepID=A0A3A3G5G9_9BURK|nr:hypothetical protein [Noviherbaspirillum sedimenti]RJG03747.1 hypothetical protein D3878_20910 [Noviherbaspirillum sedimenti]